MLIPRLSPYQPVEAESTSWADDVPPVPEPAVSEADYPPATFESRPQLLLPETLDQPWRPDADPLPRLVLSVQRRFKNLPPMAEPAVETK